MREKRGHYILQSNMYTFLEFRFEKDRLFVSWSFPFPSVSAGNCYEKNIQTDIQGILIEKHEMFKEKRERSVSITISFYYQQKIREVHKKWEEE